GQTNLSGGWLRGREQLDRAPDDGPRKVILLTDGLANVGVVEREPLVALTQRAYSNRISTTTIGLGADFDETLPPAMADLAGGNPDWAATPDAAPSIFADELEGLARVVAQNVTVEIRPLADVELLGVLNEYPSFAASHGVRLELGDAYAGERRRLVFAL